MLQRNVPLANQLIHELVDQISAGDIVRDGERLPSEAELCKLYSVSRATVREALTKLEQAGIVIRRHGVGTFINRLVKNQPGLIRGWLDEAPAFVDLITKSGYVADCKLLSVTLTPAGEVAEQLKIDRDAPVLCVEKLFMADETPVIYSWTVLPRHFIEFDEERALADNIYRQPIYQLLEERGNRKVHHQHSEVKATLANETLATLLECQRGDPLLQVEEIGYDSAQTALFYALHHFRGDCVSFQQIRIPSFTIERR
jgi:GntR family transcriptional regulator